MRGSPPLASGNSGDETLYVLAARMEDLHPDSSVALSLGHGSWFSQGEPGGSAQNTAQRPASVFAGEEDFTGTLLFRSVEPTA